MWHFGQSFGPCTVTYNPKNNISKFWPKKLRRVKKINPNFLGLELHIDTAVPTIAQFPVVQSTADSVFMSFGNDWAYKSYLFPAFVISESNEAEYATKIRISAFDQREEPVLLLWSEWGSCDGIRTDEEGECTSCTGVCGAGMVKTRRRICDCPPDLEGFPQVCFACEEELEQVEECPYVQ